jgi:glycerophosphoryl diester phosphodiesterase
MRAARAAGLRVGVWTVNDEPTMRRVITLGVDVLTTDRPDLGRRVLGR